MTVPTIRPMAAPDIGPLAELERTATGCARSLNIWEREWHAPAFSGLVAEIDRRPVGYLCYMAAGDELSINHLAVAPDYRRRGIARRLILRLLSLRDGKAVFLEVRRANRAATALYLSLGFEPVGVRSGYYRKPVDDALLFRFGGATPSPDFAVPER